jgi:hypothetical protein
MTSRRLAAARAEHFGRAGPEGSVSVAPGTRLVGQKADKFRMLQNRPNPVRKKSGTASV